MTSDLLGKLTAIDPFPDDADAPTGAVTAAAVLRDIEWRSGMQTQQEPTVEKPQRRWGPWAAAAAFAAVIVIGVVASLAMRGDTEPVDPVTTTSLDALPTTTVPQSTSTVPERTTTTIPDAWAAFVPAFEEAFNAGDEEALTALFDPGAVRVLADNLAALDGVEKMVSDFLLLHDRGTTVRLEDCRGTSTGLYCETIQFGPVEDALYGLAVRSRDFYDLNNDGEVLRIRLGVNDPAGSGREPDFHSWMQENHPEVAAQLEECCSWSRYAGEDALIFAEWIPKWVEAGRPSE